MAETAGAIYSSVYQYTSTRRFFSESAPTGSSQPRPIVSSRCGSTPSVARPVRRSGGWFGGATLTLTGPSQLRAVGLSYVDPFTRRPVAIRAPASEFLVKHGFSADAHAAEFTLPDRKSATAHHPKRIQRNR